MSKYDNEFIAVLVDENGAESIVFGTAVEDTEDTLVVAYYVTKGLDGEVKSRQVRIDKEFIKQIAVLDKRRTEIEDDEPTQLALSFEEETNSNEGTTLHVQSM